VRKGLRALPGLDLPATAQMEKCQTGFTDWLENHLFGHPKFPHDQINVFLVIRLARMTILTIFGHFLAAGRAIKPLFEAPSVRNLYRNPNLGDSKLRRSEITSPCRPDGAESGGTTRATNMALLRSCFRPATRENLFRTKIRRATRGRIARVTPLGKQIYLAGSVGRFAAFQPSMPAGICLMLV